MTAPVPHGAFYVVHYPVAQRVAFWYGDPEGPGGSVACGLFVCPAADADALDTWLSGAEGLDAVRVAWDVVRDFATEALAKYEDFANPRGQTALPLGPSTFRDTRFDDDEIHMVSNPTPGLRVQDPTVDTRHVTVRFATADRVYVDVSDPEYDYDAPLHTSASDGLYFLRKDWANVVFWVLL